MPDDESSNLFEYDWSDMILSPELLSGVSTVDQWITQEIEITDRFRTDPSMTVEEFDSLQSHVRDGFSVKLKLEDFLLRNDVDEATRAHELMHANVARALAVEMSLPEPEFIIELTDGCPPVIWILNLVEVTHRDRVIAIAFLDEWIRRTQDPSEGDSMYLNLLAKPAII